ncbi:MAG: VWA domain-containing protein, partial [Elusimicrobia bacterium]|nr:VWA domain-containing protein [Elusimicrobiota bacterium]
MNILSNVNLNAYKKKNLYIIIAVAFIIIALARPQYGTRTVMFTQTAADVIIALDVSRGMLAEDVYPNRIGASKEIMRNVLSAFRNERVGVIIFEGTAMWKVPMTFDSGAARLFLNNIQAGMMPIGGTRISRPIEIAAESILPSARDNSRIMILISDGEDHDSGMDAAIEMAIERNLRIYTIGVGTPQGAQIPLRDAQGNIIDFI